MWKLTGLLMLLLCSVGASLPSAQANAAEPVRIGVLAFRPKSQTLEQWKPLAVALKQAMPERDFVVEPLTFPELNVAVATRQLDFVLTNSGHYVLLKRRYGLSSPLSTLAINENGRHTIVFGGVIFTRAEQSDVNSLPDIKYKTIAATDTESLGGYLMQLYELSRAGINLPQDAKLVITGMPHDNVVKAVLTGRAVVGFVRSGVLEAMAREGNLDIKQIKILNRQNQPDFPVQVSTRLYPEWPFSSLQHTDEYLARNVAAALFLLENNTAATRAMGIHGFAVPADYASVETLLRELRLPPFDAAPKFTLEDIWTNYRWQILGVLLAIVMILLLGVARLLMANRKLREIEQKHSEILENVDACIYLKDIQGRYLFANRPMRELFGVSMEEVVGQSDEKFYDAETFSQLYRNDRLVLDDGKTLKAEEINFNLKNGLTATYLSVKLPLRNEAGEIYALCGISTDITERKQAENKLRLAADVFTQAREGITITATDGKILDVNDAFTRITGYSRDEVLGQNASILSSGRQGKEFYSAMWRDLIEQGHWYGEIWNRRKNGELYAEMLNISAVRDAQGNTRQYVAMFSDVTAIKEHEKQLEYLAHYDALTGLPNRVLKTDLLRQAMAQVQRREQRLAVVYLDLDEFKSINDHHGHAIGDQMLIALADRMKRVLRDGDILARLGGDEFVAVLLDLADIEASAPMFTRLLDAAAEPMHVGDLLLQVSASLGVTFYPQADDVDADQLLRQADQAMCQAKLAGKNRYHVFDAEQDSRIRGHNESLERIRSALIEREFVLYYQPKVNMRTGIVIGAEALIRWQHPEKGLLPPGVFLPLIEDHPLAIEIGEWVISAALSQMEVWQSSGLSTPVSVNIGARQLQQADFVDRLREILAAHPSISPGNLELEVLETSALEDVALVSKLIEDCRGVGVMFALDDFGTGYSSLTYLKRLPVNLLKIDQSFVHGMLDDPDDLAILDGVIGLATAFRLKVIAEGVETPAHSKMLLQLGCELAQGYGIARPMPAENFPGWVDAWRPDASWAKQSPINREDLPLLFASVEHRAWIMAMENCLNGQSVPPPPLNHHQCRFGMWLDADGLGRHAAQPAFHTIDPLHQQVHALAAELCELQAQGRSLEAQARVGELHVLRDSLLGQLNVLAKGRLW